MPEYHIYLGADHRGYKIKEELFPILSDCHENVIVEDLGAEAYNEDDDFNDPAIAVAQAVANDEHGLGVLLCGSAHGVTMQANRIRGARAINAPNEASAKIGREHDHANILCLPADELNADSAEKVIKAFCHTRPSQDERYVRRVKRLDEGEKDEEGEVEFGFSVKTFKDDGEAEDSEEE